MNRVLVIGATGKVGRHVVSQLSSAGVAVCAMARSPQSANLPTEVEVLRCDLTVPNTLDRCLDGIDSVFLVWVAPRPAVDAALQCITKHARRIVFLSSPYKVPHPLFQQPNAMAELHAHIEHTIEHSRLQWTFLRPGMFAANCVSWWAPQIRLGDVVRWPHATVPTAPIHERDIAAVAVRALCEDAHANAEYILTGPQSLSHAEQVSIVGHAIDRQLHLEEISPEEARHELLSIMPAPVVNMLLNAWGAALGQPALVTSTVADVIGVPARTFFEWATDHAAELRA